MAVRYWVGGSGTWDNSSTTNWSTTSGGTGGASAPTASDDVIINGSSGSGTITASGASFCASLVCTGYIGTLAGTISGMSGDVTLSSGGTYTDLVLVIIKTLTLTSAGKTVSQISLTNVNLGFEYTVTCADALSCTDLQLGSRSTLKLKNGVTSSISTFTSPSSDANGKLQSTSAGSQATLSDTSGNNVMDYLTVQDIAFTGGATWQLGASSVDGGNNTGLYGQSASVVDPIFVQSLA